MCRKPSARVFTALVAILLAFSVGAATARANPPYTVSVTPGKLIAGSSASVLTFQFTAVNAARGWNTVQVPAVASGPSWAAPQSSNPAEPGFVAVASQTCSSASLSSVTGAASGPWTILVNATCAKNARFAIRYGAGPSPVNVAAKAGPYEFHATRVAVQPVVNVIAGPAATLGVTGLGDAVAGTPQSPTVTATDAYGNIATRYRGTVHFDGRGDPVFASFFNVVPWDVPADYTFTAGDAGAHTFAATAYYAGTQTLTVADTRPGSIIGLQDITISPGPTSYVSAFPGSNDGSAIPGQTIRMAIEAVAEDAYGNINTGDNEFMNVSVNKEGSDCTGDECNSVLGAFLENGRHTFHINVAVVSTRVQVNMNANRQGVSGLGSIILWYGAPPDLDAVNLNWDPRTQNPDGSYSGSLDVKDPDTHELVQIDPNSLIVSGDFTVNSNGTATVPVTALTLDGATYNIGITVTTPTDPATGELQTAPPYTSGTKIQVMGCQDVDEAFEDLKSTTPPPAGLPDPPACPNGTFNAVTVDDKTAFIRTGDAPTQAAVIVGTGEYTVPG